MGRRLGLIIGVNQYQDPTFKPLQFAENDARALAQWLVNEQGGKWAPADVEFVQGARVTRELVEQLVAHVCVNVAGPGDLVLIYFAGHAFVNEQNGEGYLAFANSFYQQPATALHIMSMLRQVISRSRAGNVLFIFDCFQTGPVWSARRSSPYDSKPLLGPALLGMLQQGGGRMFLCSCRGNELASEAGERNLGLLAHRLILGLAGSALDKSTGQVTLQRLHAFLFNALGEQQRPQLFGQEQGPVVLTGNMPSTTPEPQYEAYAPGLLTTDGLSFKGQPPMGGASLAQATRTQSTTGQLSPQMSATTSGQLMLSAAEQQRQQQAAMLLRQARHLIQMNNSGEAYNLIEQLLSLEPMNTTALILKGQLLGSVGRFQEALPAINQALQLDGNNALAWSMQAALLTNIGRYQEAMNAIEHSLELDPQNPETYSIKSSIMEKMAAIQSGTSSQQLQKPVTPRPGGSRSLLLDTGIQVLALIIGAAGAVLPIFLPTLPILISFLLESLALSVLCVNAARGTYLYGASRLVMTLLISLLTAGILGGVYKFGYTRLIDRAILHPSLLIPELIFAAWLIVAALLPLLIAIGGFLAGIIRGVRR